MARTRLRSDMIRNADRKFPVRLRVLVPEGGYGRMSDEMNSWLKARYGLEGFAWTSAYVPGLPDATHFSFPEIEGAVAFLERFPSLEYAADADVRLQG